MAPDPLRRCILQLSRLPGVGERTATRYAYWLVRQSPEVAQEIAAALSDLALNTRRCEVCCDVGTQSPCRRCGDPARDPALICVVERPQDILAIERSGEFPGQFHVLDGAISPLEGIGPEALQIRPLLARMSGAREVVLATDPDVEGDATALYLARLIKPLGVRVTRLAHGIAVGTELEFADRSSVARALEHRREL